MSFPADWPEPGELDLAVHDLPHRSSTTEWWYVNSHFETVEGRKFSVFAAFFQIARKRDKVTGKTEYSHSLTWAISDLEDEKYMAESWVDRHAPGIGLERIDKGDGAQDERLNRAMREVLVKGHVPLPDQMFKVPARVEWDTLDIEYEHAKFRKLANGSYHMELFSEHFKCGCELTFKPTKPAIRHGVDGVVKGTRGEDMFYYFIPRCEVTGSVTIDGTARALESGQGWYDHEFGGYGAAQMLGAPAPEPTAEEIAAAQASADSDSDNIDHQPADIAWNWFAGQLENGTDLTAYTMVQTDTGEVHGTGLILVGPNGERTSFEDVVLEPTREWNSTRTFFPYPTAWHLTSEAAQLDLIINAAFDDQELMTVLSKPAFWEGRCDVTGRLAGEAVHGLGYVERSGFEPLKNLDDFFGAVGKEVRKSVRNHLPKDPTHEQTRDMIASKERDHYMEGVDRYELSRALADPVRLITDRGGKSWRSYAALACCDVVGGDSRKWTRWLAMPEFMHVGSLIVDDVQDKSEIRRGGPACHVVYGDALAINAGTACYFMGQGLLFGDDLDDAGKLRLYDLYFEALRAGHAGQAMDLYDKADLMARAVETGDGTELESRIRATHRLKTAAPAAALARMGALVGGGTEEQIEGVGRYFEALGLAFQIVDDVLNIRGFKKSLKIKAEDVRNGTITLPVAKAMSRLEADDRKWLSYTLASKPEDDGIVQRAVQMMEDCGAVQSAADEASEVVENAWRRVDPLLRDSFPKIMLRAFSWYVLERHY